VDDLARIVDLHLRAQRQGPGGDAEARLAIDLARLDPEAPLVAADLGCGTGAATLLLARALNATITAIDLMPEFIDVLALKAEREGLRDRVRPVVGSMDDLSFQEGELDLIWSEGAVYNVGFEKGVAYWRRFLKPGGVLVVSEITWTTASRPAEIEAHWTAEYREIATASEKLAVLERTGYAPSGYFVLPEHCWRDNYYEPMRQSFPDYLARHGNSDGARAVVAAEQEEMRLYEAYSAYYSYGVYIARRVA
jgi:SAM-dependent methyltransferase